jgi:deoxycytidylate deaminase
VYDPVSGGSFFGYNGFPRGVEDLECTWNRRMRTASYPDSHRTLWSKYDLVVHAEVNASQKALVAGVHMRDAWLICTHLPCERCMRDVVASLGIRTVYYESDDYASCTKDTRAFADFIAETYDLTLQRITV